MTKLKKLMLSGGITTAAVALAFAGSAFAANGNGVGTNTESGQHRYQLSAAERTQREAEMESKITSAFDTAESAGKITAEQKTKLLEFHEAVHAQMKAGNRDAAETAIKAMHDWMTANNIDSSVMPTPPAGGHGPGGHNGHTQNITSTN